MADQIVNLLHQSLCGVIRQLENSNNDSDSLDSICYRLDWLYNALVRYLDVNNNARSEQVVNLVRDAKDHLSLNSAYMANVPGYSVEQLADGNRGRPKFNITKEQLEFLLERGFSLPNIASILGVSLRTIERRINKFNISTRLFYSEIDDDTLDDTIRDISRTFPSAGYRRMTGFLLSRGIRVQQERIRLSMRRVDPEGVLLRSLQLTTVRRRKYQVYAPLALWHIDGNHKLIRWRFVIHGGIDGYSRMIVFLQASTNNLAATVFQLFVGSVAEFGLPSRVRTDKGGENVDIARYMLSHPLRGPDRGSHITGRSVHNQRIERLWRDVFFGCTFIFHNLFSCMEESGILNPDDEVDLYALHYVFLPRLNKQLAQFVSAHSRTPISTERNMSPIQLWISGMSRVWNTDHLVAEELAMSEEDLAYFGVDWDGPLPSSQWNIPNDDNVPVEVPDTPHLLQDRDYQQLVNTVNPLHDSNEYGVDLYMEAKTFLLRCLGR
ncbi:hypothetical protein QZH41_011963 [Actinostola sp. cb2023]|nr:hypothetical protein QZH41_011963 [Actinostola sp. cb2023]